MTEGDSNTPGDPGTSGEIETDALDPGQVEFSGWLTDNGQHNPTVPKFWSKSWNWAVVFPPAPYDGILSFSFAEDWRMIIEHASAHLGYVGTPVYMLTSSDAVSQPLSNWTLVAWPTNVSLPHPPYERDSSFPVSGTFAVSAGQQAAVALFCFVFVALASGVWVCRFNPFTISGFWTRKASIITAGSYGSIEYCFHPQRWVDAVAVLRQSEVQQRGRRVHGFRGSPSHSPLLRKAHEPSSPHSDQRWSRVLSS